MVLNFLGKSELGVLHSDMYSTVSTWNEGLIV